MKLFIAIGCLLALLAGCATLGLDPDATQAERQAALCRDAQLGILTAQAALQTVQPPLTDQWWQRYIGAAMTIRDLYCPQTQVASK